ARPVAKGEPATGIRTPSLVTVKALIVLLKLTTKRNRPAESVPIAEGKDPPALTKGEPATSVRLPPVATFNTVIEPTFELVDWLLTKRNFPVALRKGTFEFSPPKVKGEPAMLVNPPSEAILKTFTKVGPLLAAEAKSRLLAQLISIPVIMP